MLFWGFGILSIVYEENIEDFVLPINLAIEYLTEASIRPLSKSQWEKTFKKKSEDEKEKEEKSRTMQLIKIGKFDVKYLKKNKSAPNNK